MYLWLTRGRSLLLRLFVLEYLPSCEFSEDWHLCLSGQGGPPWPAHMFPETKKETRARGVPASTFRFRTEISRETRAQRVFGLHSGNSRVSLSLRAGPGQNLSEAKRGNRQNTRYLRILPIWLILLFGPKPADFHGVSSGN